MKTFFAIFAKTIHTQMIHKFNYMVNVLTHLSSVALSILSWIAIYRSNHTSVVQGMTYREMMVYLLLTNLSALLFTTSNVLVLGQQVKTGKLNIYLLRPYSLLFYAFAEFCGEKFLYYCIYFGVLVLLIIHNGSLYYLLVMLFLIINIFMFFILMRSIGNLAFWMIQIWPMRPIINAFYMLFGGLLFPLNLLDDKIFVWLQWNPFSLVGFQLSRALQMKLSYPELGVCLSMSLFWLCLSLVANHYLFFRGMKNYEGVGA